jgi:hypothetical protein
MLTLEFDLKTVGGAEDAPSFDPYEIDYLLQSTRHQIEQHVRARLGDYVCPSHGQAPLVRVSGQYDVESEQLDVQYAVEMCCSLATAQAVALLSR